MRRFLTAPILENVAAIRIACSLMPLYEDELLFDQLRARLEGRGFEMRTVFPDDADEITGRILPFEGLFVRKGVFTR